MGFGLTAGEPNIGANLVQDLCAVVVSVKESSSISHYSYATLGNVNGEQAMSIDYQLLARSGILRRLPEGHCFGLMETLSIEQSLLV